MTIEQFIALSVGEWQSMRSGHSLAFRQFEQILSFIKIEQIDPADPRILKMLRSEKQQRSEHTSPFSITWEVDTEWSEKPRDGEASGCSIFVPIPTNKCEGIMIRSSGYLEKIKVISSYKLIDQKTLILKTKYQNSTAEEKIWFVSDCVRCRSSIVKTSKESGIVQISFASEVKSNISRGNN